MSTVKMVSDLILQRQWDKIGAELALTAALAVRCCRPPPENQKSLVCGAEAASTRGPGASASPLSAFPCAQVVFNPLRFGGASPWKCRLCRVPQRAGWWQVFGSAGSSSIGASLELAKRGGRRVARSCSRQQTLMGSRLGDMRAACKHALAAKRFLFRGPEKECEEEKVSLGPPSK